ncbi:MAG: DUF5674 family protein [Patescibacteria group bacterium]|nr:DUF5674 family protein [Patescibacteria group bacterium]
MMDYRVEIIKEKINKEHLKDFLNNPFKEVIKFVVDIENNLIALGGELHSDTAEELIEQGSDNRNLWGGNFYPLKEKAEEKIEYTSLINIKPSQDSFSMDIENKDIILKINKVIEEFIEL